jgi:hypothetical protein
MIPLMHRYKAGETPQKLKTTLGKAMKVVNFIQARSLNSRIFNILCEVMGSSHA